MSHHEYLDPKQIEQYILFESIPSDPESEDEQENNSHQASTISSPGVSYAEFIEASEVHFDHDYFQNLDEIQLDQEIPIDEIDPTVPVSPEPNSNSLTNVLPVEQVDKICSLAATASLSSIPEQNQSGVLSAVTSSPQGIDNNLVDNGEPSTSKKFKTYHTEQLFVIS